MRKGIEMKKERDRERREGIERREVIEMEIERWEMREEIERERGREIEEGGDLEGEREEGLIRLRRQTRRALVWQEGLYFWSSLPPSYMNLSIGWPHDGLWISQHIRTSLFSLLLSSKIRAKKRSYSNSNNPLPCENYVKIFHSDFSWGSPINDITHIMRNDTASWFYFILLIHCPEYPPLLKE